jgi:hypothetical protein
MLPAVPSTGRTAPRSATESTARLKVAAPASANRSITSGRIRRPWVPSGRKELPKAIQPIRSYFDYLIKKHYVYNFSVFFNINITHINLKDVRQLSETAHDVGIATRQFPVDANRWRSRSTSVTAACHMPGH